MSQRVHMSISITRHIAEYVREKVKSGSYNSGSEVVREALRRMEQEEERQVRVSTPTADDLLGYMTREQLADLRKRLRADVAGLKSRSAAEG